jgi:hypothetical protein
MDGDDGGHELYGGDDAVSEEAVHGGRGRLREIGDAAAIAARPVTVGEADSASLSTSEATASASPSARQWPS